MGKSQKKKAMRRHNPMRVPDSHLPKGLAAASESSKKSENILPIIQKMSSADSAERKWACVAVSNLIQNDSSTRRLLQGKNVVGELITRLTDSEEEVVFEAMGSLRNLYIDGGYDICAEMYNKNILAPVKTFVPKISQVLSQYLENPKDASENAKKVMYEFAENVITVLWCLSETSNKALNAINEIGLIPFLMSFLASRERLSIVPVMAAAQCLYVLTDENDAGILALKSDASYIACLLSITNDKPKNLNGKQKEPNDHRTLMIQILASGILRNISPLPPAVTGSIIDIDKEIILPLLQPVVSSVSLSEVATTAQQLVDSIASEPPSVEKLSIKNAPKSDHKSTHELELEQLEGKLRSIQLALEILTGVCATLPDPSVDVQEDGKDLSDDMEEDDLREDLQEAEMDVEMNGEQEKTAYSEQLSFPSLVPSLLNLIYPTSLSFPPLAAPSPHPPTTSALSAIHISAMECLNNIFLSLATSPNPKVKADQEGGRKVWNDLWAVLGVVGLESGLGQERRQELWAIAVGVLWGVGIVYKGSLVATEEQIQILKQICSSTSDERLQVKCIGTLECLAQHPESVVANKIISDYLVSLLPTSTAASLIGTEPLIQAVSALIDIYSDETLAYDINFRQEGILQKLVSSVDGVRKVIRGIDKRREGSRDLRRRGDEVRENLVAFIQYRRSLRL
ncbi:ARM repeat-containing protein [Marasmius fiardii PR-910]|nr:ARM repeat-containing protein [Marasmius fiardii PR-910]